MPALHDLFPHPIIQAPMAGGVTTPELVAAVSNAGALGSLAAPLLTPLSIIEHAEHIRRLTARPFAINLFVLPRPKVDLAEIEQAKLLLHDVIHELGMQTLATPTRWCEDFEDQLDALITAKPAVASFTFDILHGSQLERVHRAGILVIGTATHVQEALAWQALGADAICVQGVEAGGHRGTFIGTQEDAQLGLFDLLAACRLHIHIPLIAAGGIMHGRDIAKARAAGADFVQMGTAFLCCVESGAHPAYQRALHATSLRPAQKLTRQTRAFSGRIARGLDNRFIQMMAEREAQVPAYPIQNALTGSLRATAAKDGLSQYMSLWCGTGVAQIRNLAAADLIAALVAETKAA